MLLKSKSCIVSCCDVIVRSGKPSVLFYNPLIVSTRLCTYSWVTLLKENKRLRGKPIKTSRKEKESLTLEDLRPSSRSRTGELIVWSWNVTGVTFQVERPDSRRHRMGIGDHRRMYCGRTSSHRIGFGSRFPTSRATTSVLTCDGCWITVPPHHYRRYWAIEGQCQRWSKHNELTWQRTRQMTVWNGRLERDKNNHWALTSNSVIRLLPLSRWTLRFEDCRRSYGCYTSTATASCHLISFVLLFSIRNFPGPKTELSFNDG